ncbi:hypothetical protein DIPPA_07886 [Diplonema papillatum]|nr:hypothetical protein DIPPA_07886 [Diplonema papillatum]
MDTTCCIIAENKILIGESRHCGQLAIMYIDRSTLQLPLKENRRLCFDLLPPEEKMEIVTDFRSMQLKGYDDSLFEFLQQYYPEAVSAQGLTPDETLRRLSYINRLVYEHGAESEHRWVELVKKVQRHQNLSQKERLSELLEKAPKAVVDSTGVPVYTGKNIYDDMPDEVSTEIAAETGKTTSSPSSGWRFM